jgi:DNA-binding IclR family transcriptional regulator
MTPARSDPEARSPGSGGRRQARPAAPDRSAGERERSIRRGVEVLLTLGSEEAVASGGLGVSRIAELLEREKSQVSRALKALSEYGLVERNADSTYCLGWRLFALAEVTKERRLLDTATPHMRRLAVRLGERVHLSVLHGVEVLTLGSESPGRVVEAVGWAGRVTPAYCTSAGRALLIDTDPPDIERMFAHVDLRAHGPQTVRSPRELAERVTEARASGVAVVDGEFERDLIGVAVPVRDGGGAIVASLNASAPRFRLIDRVDAAARELGAVASELARELGSPRADGGLAKY